MKVGLYKWIRRDKMDQSIEIMKDRIVKILLDNEPSIYLFGSIVLDDFKLGWSDIDILCLTKSELTDVQANQLLNLRQALQDEYKDNPYFPLFEGGFLSLNGFINGTSDTVVYWGTRGQRIRDKYYLDPFSMMELLESGGLLYGDEIRDKFIYPTKESLINAVINHYETIRKHAITTDRSLYSAGWMLDIARCIYTLRTGKIIAKTKAGKWALDNNLVPDVEVMRKVIRIREEPNKYKNDIELMKWLETLGEYIQRFADVLEEEILKVKVYNIRRARKEGSEALAHIIVESWKSAYSNIIPLDEMARFLDKKRRQGQFEKFIEDGEIVLIGFYEEKPFGLAFANKDNDEQLKDCGSIYSIYLLEEYWGKGLASKLMDEVINILKEEGCKQVSLWVYEANKRARKFYEKCGFVFDGNKKHSRFSNKPLELRYIKQI